ncbi:MAG TPA: dihydrodipicolinate synthase family protein [Longimicrobiales bacterium]|nr:dihydrodipicolinate synthase family protein [Longimicrobiales bacterium]
MPDFQEWLSGVLIPVTTPFDPVTGEVAPVSMRENIRRWTAEPIDGIVLFGSTGEGILLDEDEKLRLTAMVRDVMPGGLPLVAGAGAESTRATARQAQRLAESGADAVLVHAPSYFGPSLSPAAVRDHFVAVADASPVPVIVYHIPKFAKVTMEPGLVGELARHPNIRGLKDSSGDVKRFAEYTTVCGRECALFMGNGSLLYTALELGAAGGIVAVGLLAPGLCAEIVSAFRSGETQRAGQLQERIAPVHREVVAPFGAQGLKAALELIGYVGGPPRAPLKPLGEKERAQVARVMQDAGLLPG